MVSASRKDDKVAWYENDGSGNFGEQQIITTNAEEARSVYAADLDNDEDIDILSASSADNKIAWYENDGSGNFGEQQIITTAVDEARSVYAADLDNDGDNDVLSSSVIDGKIAWYENDGNGNFGGQQIIATDVNEAGDLHAVDLDNDGGVDVLVASQNDDKIVWYKNDGNGNFEERQIITTTTRSVYSIYSSDLDNDGNIDVLAYWDNIIVWYENDGSGNFEQRRFVTMIDLMVDPHIGYPLSAYAADLDNDGDIDVLSSSNNGETVWYENLLIVGSTYGNNSLVCYPNPTSDGLIVQQPTAQVATYTLYNTLGEVVDKGTLSARIHNFLFVGHLPMGIYYLQVNDMSFKVMKR